MARRKPWLRIVLFVLAALVVLFVVESSIVKSALRKTIHSRLGFDLEVGRVRHGFIHPVFEIWDLKLINPEDFPDGEAMDIRRVRVNADLRSLFTDTIHLRELVLDIPKIVVVRREDGQTNLQRLNEAIREETRPPSAPAPSAPAGGGAGTAAAVSNARAPAPAPKPEALPPWYERTFRIDRLELKMGSVEVHDYTRGGDKPRVGIYELNVDQVLKDVTDPSTIGVVIAATVAEKVGLQMAGDLGSLIEQHRDDLDKAGEQLDKAFKNLEKSFKGMFGTKKTGEAAPQK